MYSNAPILGFQIDKTKLNREFKINGNHTSIVIGR